MIRDIEESFKEKLYYLNEEGEIMGLAQILRQEGRQEECIASVTRLLR